MRAMALVLLLALASGALAGTPEAPEITDPAGDAGAGGSSHDILAAWVEEDGRALIFHLRLAGLQNPHTGDTWAVVFEADGRTLAAGAFGSTSLPDSPYYWYGTWRRGVGPGPGAVETGQGAAELGAPATLTFEMPKSFLNATAGMRLENLTAVAEVAGYADFGPIADGSQLQREVVFDEGTGDAYTVLRDAVTLEGNATAEPPPGNASAETPPRIEGPRPLPALPALVAAGALALLARARRR